MAMTNRVFSTNYMQDFDPMVFLSQFYKSLTDHTLEGNMVVMEMQFLHDAFEKYDIKGKRLLDIGTGPTIHSVISASAHAENIYLSDLVQQNREVLKQWTEGTLDHSFEDFFKFVVDAEGKRQDPAEREMQMRKKISGILAIDLLQEDPLSPTVSTEFDIITSSLCLEAVASDISVYKNLALRVANMLKTGGYLILFDVLGETFYRVGKHIFRELCIHSDSVRQVWKDAGFEIVDWKEVSDSTGSKSASDFEGYFLLVAKKTMNKINN